MKQLTAQEKYDVFLFQTWMHSLPPSKPGAQYRIDIPD